MMQTTHFLKPFLAVAVFSLLLAGCASTPAPVINHSFGGSSPQPATQSSPVPSPPAATTQGVQTFGLGGHANGTVGTAGYTKYGYAKDKAKQEESQKGGKSKL